MEIIDDKCRKVKNYTKTLENNGRRCYAVKVCIEKNPDAGKKVINDSCIREEKPSCLPTSPVRPPCPPPPIVPLVPLRNPVHICCTCQPIGSDASKRRNKCGRTRPNQCQTAYKELKHCGHQTSLGCEKSTKHCQTELERSCCAEGVAHDKNTCTKTCCNKRNCEKRDASCQPEIINDNVKKNVTNNCQRKAACGNRPAACKQKFDFPFVGRTPSGNLKVCPNMVSYENKEFGILVANPNSIRTSVRRVTNCEMMAEERESQCPSPPPVSPSPATCRRPQRFHYESSGCSSQNDGSCKTACPTLPPPTPPRLKCCPPHRQHYHHHRHRSHRSRNADCDALEFIQAPICMERDRLESECQTEPVQVHTSRNERGYTDGWNYTNPQYQQESHYRDKIIHDTRIPRNVQQQREGYLDTGMREWEHENAGREDFNSNNFSYNDNSGGRHNLELEKHGNGPEAQNHHDERRAPYIPAFPQEKIRQQQQRHQDRRMPDYTREGYHTPTHDDDDDGNSISKGSTTNQLKRDLQQQQPSRGEEYAKTADPELVGKLHYVVKGSVDPDAKVKVGNTVFPVQSVILEILNKPPVEGSANTQQHRHVKLPDFDSLPITFYDDGSNDTRRRNEMNQQESRRNVEGQLSLHHRHDQVTDQESLTDYSDLPPGYSKKGITSQVKLQEDCQSCKVNDKKSCQVKKSNAGTDLSRQTQSQAEIYFKNQQQASKTHSNPYVESETPYVSEAPNDGSSQKSYSNVPPGYFAQDPRASNSKVKQDEMPNSDYVESKYLVPVSTQDTILRIVAPNSSYQRVGQSVDGIPIPRKSSMQLLQEEEKIDPKIGVLPNLDVIHGQVLVFGGVNPLEPCTGENSGKDVYMYSQDTDQWTLVGVLPHSRTHFGLARVENDVYIIGGTDPENKDRNGKNLAVHTNLKLDLRSGKWDLVAGLDKGRSHCGCVAIGKNIFVIGGNIESRATSTCLVFNTESQSWSQIASLNSTRANMGVAVYGSGILVAGGTSKDARKPVLETVMYYEPSHDRWTAWQNLPTPRAFCSLAVTSDNQIYLIAGAGVRDNVKRKNSSMPDILTWDQENGNWMEVGTLQNPRHGHTSTVLENGSILVIAGVSSHAGGLINSVEIWSPSSANSSMAQSFRMESGMCAITL